MNIKVLIKLQEAADLLSTNPTEHDITEAWTILVNVIHEQKEIRENC